MKSPKPEHWPGRPLKALSGMALFGAGGVFSAVWTAVFVNRGDFLTAIITGGFAVSTLTLALAAALPQLGCVAVRGTFNSTGTTLRPSPIVVVLVIIAFLAAVPSGVLYVIFVPRGDVGISMSRGEQIFTPFLIGFGVVCAVAGLIALLVRGRPGYVQLTLHGFEIADILFTYSGSWDDVTDITDEATDKQKQFPIVIVMNNGPPHVTQGAKGYTPHGNALYWMIRHYWLHPENREELTDGRALERLRGERFDPE